MDCRPTLLSATSTGVTDVTAGYIRTMYCGVGRTVWELFEFTIDRTGLFYAQRGLIDTMLDLLADAGGAVMTVLLLCVRTELKSEGNVIDKRI